MIPPSRPSRGWDILRDFAGQSLEREMLGFSRKKARRRRNVVFKIGIHAYLPPLLMQVNPAKYQSLLQLIMNIGEGLAAINYEKDWIIDSGCSHHLTGDSSLFSHWNEYKGNNVIVIADNIVHPVVNEGSVKVKATEQETDSVTLNSVYHVPVKGKKVKSLYTLTANDAYVQKTGKQDNVSLWHAHLAHASSSSSSIQFGARGDETSRDDVGEKENEEESAQNEELQLRRSTRDHDMVVICDNEQEVSKLVEELAIWFEMKNLGRIHHFLGLEVSICKDGNFLSQARYLQGILEKFKMADCKEASSPMDENLKRKVNEGKELPDAYPYRKLVGSLLYLTISRPDISYSVGVISQFMQKPRKLHLDVAKRILRYLKHTKSYGLFYKRDATHTHTHSLSLSLSLSLCGFTNADWAGDASSRQSTYGYIFNLGSAVISWCSKKQATTAFLSTKAEYNAATLAAQECTWLRRLVNDICHPIDKPVQIYCDNLSTIRLASSPIFHARTKHIEVHYHFIREKVLEEEIDLIKVDTNEQVTDLFTKALAQAKFEKFRARLSLVSQVSTKGGC
ncbi:hypothetical protein RJ639_007464 [Escallonia herrerae]|uniref:Reverse transcriptase Ty1/copia-type domain-containing protein n=1 Tax=Escallonia herrerae TaxID=1293975 RepID=A0AA89ATX0_9ASTE|nr:hypothetical protein RJ639_007464 [Escallonia herrerae]